MRPGAKLTLQLVAALAAASLGIMALQWGVTRADARARAAAEPARARTPELGFRLAPVGGRVVLAASGTEVAADLAPVVQVLADGTVAVRRPAPLANGPGGTHMDRGAAILVPTTDLGALGPAARGALLDVLGQLVLERPVPLARCVLPEGMRPETLQALLAWMP